MLCTFVSSSAASGSSARRQTVWYSAESAELSEEASSELLSVSTGSETAFSERMPLFVVMETLSSAEAVSPAGLKAPNRSALVSSKQAALLPDTV